MFVELNISTQVCWLDEPFYVYSTRIQVCTTRNVFVHQMNTKYFGITKNLFITLEVLSWWNYFVNPTYYFNQKVHVQNWRFLACFTQAFKAAGLQIIPSWTSLLFLQCWGISPVYTPKCDYLHPLIVGIFSPVVPDNNMK